MHVELIKELDYEDGIQYQVGDVFYTSTRDYKKEKYGHFLICGRGDYTYILPRSYVKEVKS